MPLTLACQQKKNIHFYHSLVLQCIFGRKLLEQFVLHFESACLMSPCQERQKAVGSGLSLAAQQLTTGPNGPANGLSPANGQKAVGNGLAALKQPLTGFIFCSC